MALYMWGGVGVVGGYKGKFQMPRINLELWMRGRTFDN